MEIPEKEAATSLGQSRPTVQGSIGSGIPGAAARPRRTALVRIASLGVMVVVLTIVAYKMGWFDLRRAATTIERLQSGRNTVTVAASFFAIFALATALGFPALPFTVAGGAMFGHILGTALSWGAAVIGMMLGYALARGVGRETARRWISKRAVGAALTRSTSLLTLLRLRLVPVIPLSVVNFAAGLARTRFDVYVLASAIGVLPATAVFAYFADSLVQGLHGARTHAYWDVAIASAVLMLMSLLPMLAKKVIAR
jgi:uncharacterized membrane protein YdjX (TVP38/TMEM64 family)